METDEAPESAGTSMRNSPFVESPWMSALAEIVTTPFDFANDQPVPELSALDATGWPLTTRKPRTETAPSSSMPNEK